LGEYAARKLKKGDRLYVEGTLVSSIREGSRQRQKQGEGPHHSVANQGAVSPFIVPVSGETRKTPLIL